MILNSFNSLIRFTDDSFWATLYNVALGVENHAPADTESTLLYEKNCINLISQLHRSSYSCALAVASHTKNALTIMAVWFDGNYERTFVVLCCLVP